jgi:hypothetical protein
MARARTSSGQLELTTNLRSMGDMATLPEPG